MKSFINASREQGQKFYQDFNDKGSVTMLNLLLFRKIADYTNLEELRPADQISGKESYELYLENTMPLLTKFKAKILFYGSSKSFLIGPETEKWDEVLLVEHQSVAQFMKFAENEDYLKGAGHRTAALEDSRLLPMIQNPTNNHHQFGNTTQ